MSVVTTRRRGAAGLAAHAGRYGVLVALDAFSLGPLVVLMSNALKAPADLRTNPLGLPTSIVFDNFAEAWRLGNFGVTLVNSLVLTAGTVLGIWVIAGMAAYGLARLRPRGSDGLLLYLFLCSALPVQLFLVPLFFLWSRLHLTNSLFGLIVIYWAIFSPFATLLLRSYLLTLPVAFEEAARLDGAGELRVLARILLPIAWPGFLTIGLVSGLSAYNEFFFAITFINSDSVKPVTTSFLAFENQFTTNWTLTSAAALIVVVPVAAFFLAFQRQFVQGLASAGLKG